MSLKVPVDWKHWVWIADLHTGSPVGLTPDPNNPFQTALLDRYIDAINWFQTNYRKPDVVVVVGDPTEGVDRKLDVDDPDIVSQQKKSAEVICMQEAQEEYIIITGTKVHTHLEDQEIEENLADKIKLKSLELYGHVPKVTVRRKLKTTINGWFTAEARHFISRSIIPHGRATAQIRTQMWNIMNAALAASVSDEPIEYPDLLVFGHTHYYQEAANAWGRTVILPSWKAIGDKFGDEICDGHIDVGLVGTFFSNEDEKQWHMKERLYLASVVSRTESR
jgi:hypothetical protein